MKNFLFSSFFRFFVISLEIVKCFSLIVLLLNDELSRNFVKMTNFCFCVCK